MNDIEIGCIKIGMLSSPDLILEVARFLSEHKSIPIILDPVMVATSGDLLLKETAIEVLVKEMLPLCEIVTPNVYEAGILTNSRIESVREMEIAAKRISYLGAKNVLVKGGDRKADMATDVLYHSQSQKFFHYERPMIRSSNTHGTGCTLSSAIASYRSKGIEIREAVKLSKEYLYEAILAGAEYKLGHGRGPVHHFFNHRY